MKSKFFKKAIAVVCAAALMLTAASVVMLASVSAEAESVSKVVVDFEDQNGVGKYIGDAASKLVDTSTITNTVFDAWKVNAGNYCASVNGKGNWAAINLPENWWVYTNESDGITYTKPNIISFDIMCTSTAKSASLNGVAFTTGDSSEALIPNKFTYLTAVGQVTASAKTYRTVTYKIPTTLDLSQFTRVVVNCWGTNDACYIDKAILFSITQGCMNTGTAKC